MIKEPYSISIGELNKAGRNNIPVELIPSRQLIYSSPATLAFNSPGATGFGVKRAGLAVPGSVMLLVAPGCCGRNTKLLAEIRGYEDRFFFLMMDGVMGCDNLIVNNSVFLHTYFPYRVRYVCHDGIVTKYILCYCFLGRTRSKEQQYNYH